MALLKHKSFGFYSAAAEKSAIEAMETAIWRLDDASRDQKAEEDWSVWHGLLSLQELDDVVCY